MPEEKDKSKELANLKNKLAETDRHIDVLLIEKNAAEYQQAVKAEAKSLNKYAKDSPGTEFSRQKPVVDLPESPTPEVEAAEKRLSSAWSDVVSAIKPESAPEIPKPSRRINLLKKNPAEETTGILDKVKDIVKNVKENVGKVTDNAKDISKGMMATPPGVPIQNTEIADLPETPEHSMQINLLKPETPEEEKVVEEIKKLPEKEREEIARGIYNIGFRFERNKNDYFAKTLDWARKGLTRPKGTVDRFAEALRDSYLRDADLAHARAKDLAESKGDWAAKLKNPSLLFGNVLKYGRIIGDLTTHSFASPLRYVMMAGAATARLSSSAKEARLQNEDVIEKTRLENVAEAQEEVMRIYAAAGGVLGSEDKALSAEQIKNQYLMQLPDDLRNRLEIPAIGNSFIQNRVKDDISWGLKRIENSLQKIDENNKLTWEEKIVEKEKIVKKFRSSLEDYDRLVTQYGTVDGWAMAGRYAQTAGKTVVTAVQVETLLLSLEKVFDYSSKVMSHSEIFNDTKEWAKNFYEDGKGVLGRALEKLKIWDDKLPTAETPNNISPVTPTQPEIPIVATTTPSLELLPSDGGPEPTVSQVPYEDELGEGNTLEPATATSVAETVESPKEVFTFDGGKGGIKGLIDFKAQIRAAHPDLTKLPQNIQDFLNDDKATKQAIELGLFKPDQTEESANILVGSTLRFEAGKLIFHDARTGEDVEKYSGAMFDYNKPTPTTEVTAIPLDLEHPVVDEAAMKDFMKAVDNPDKTVTGSVTHEEIKAALEKKYNQPVKYEMSSASSQPIQQPVRKIINESGGVNVNFNGGMVRPLATGVEVTGTGAGGANISFRGGIFGNQLGMPRGFTEPLWGEYQSNIGKLFPDNLSKDAIEQIMTSRASSILENKDHIGEVGPISNLHKYLDRLQQVTGMQPKGRGFLGLGTPETVEDFIIRTTIEAERIGKLDQVKLGQ